MDTFTFYSVSQEQVDVLMKGLKPIEGTEDTYEGDTPLGEIKAQVNFTPGSGQLQVVVLDKPFLLHVETIKTHIRNAIDNALVPSAPQHDGPVAKPVSEPANAPRTRQRPTSPAVPVEPVAPATTTQSTETATPNPPSA